MTRCLHDDPLCPSKQADECADFLSAKYCKRCGGVLPSFGWPMRYRDAHCSRFVEEEDAFSSVIRSLPKQVDTELPLIMAGRYLVLARSNPNRLEAVDFDDLHFGKFPLHQLSEASVFSKPLALGDGSRFPETATLVFASPYVYIAAAGRIERVHIRAGRDTAKNASDEAITHEHIHPSGAATAAIRPDRSDIAFPLGKRFALLTTDRYHKIPRGQRLAWSADEAQADWHSPLYNNGHWYFVSKAGELAVMKQNDEAPFWQKMEDFRGTIIDSETVQLSVPCMVDDYLFAAYQHGDETGVQRLDTTTGTVEAFREPDLDFQANVPPLPFHDQGVLWPAHDGKKAFFVPISGRKGVLLDLIGFELFQHQHVIQLQRRSVMLTTAEDQETSKLVAFNLEKTNRRLVGQVLGGPLSVPWGRVLSLVYVPGHPCSVIQTRDKLYFVYLQ